MENNKYFMMMPDGFYDEFKQLANDVKTVLNQLPNSGNNPPLGDWIPESDARSLLGRKTTWFYNKRISGELTGKKRGGKWWYAKSEILKFIEG